MRILLAFAFYLLSFQLSAQKLSSYYDPAKRAYGYKDSNGTVVIAPTYSLAMDFSEGLGLVRANEKYGYINASGKTVIPLVYYKANSFSSGVAAVSDSTQYFFIDKAGKKKIPQSFANANPFSDGLAEVMNKDQLWGYINITGNLVIPYQYTATRSFSEGLAFTSKETGTWQAINQKNEVKFTKQAVRIWPYRHGFAAIQLKNEVTYNYGNEWNFINKEGELLSNDRFEGVDYFDGKTASVRNYNSSTQGSTYGLIDNTGKLVIPAIYPYLKKYGKGYLFSTDTEMSPAWFGYINADFEVAIPEKYKFKGTFGDSLFLVQVKENYAVKLNLLNKKGKELIPLSYQSYDFYDHKKNPILLFYTNYGTSIPGRVYNIHTGLIGQELMSPDMKYELFVDTKAYSTTPIMDLSGKVLVDKSFNVMYHSSYRNFGADTDKFEKLKRKFPVAGKDSTWFFDKKIKKLIPLKYFVFSGDDFSDGLLKVTSDFSANEFSTNATTKYGFLDSTFKLVIPMTLSAARNFKDGFARIAKPTADGFSYHYGFINKKGIEIIKAQFEDATDFSNGYSIAQQAGKKDGIAIVDKTGKIKTVIPGVKYFIMLEADKDGLVFAESTQGKWGLWNVQGKNIIPAEYDLNKNIYSSVPSFDKKGQVALNKDGKMLIFDKAGNQVK